MTAQAWWHCWIHQKTHIMHQCLNKMVQTRFWFSIPQTTSKNVWLQEQGFCSIDPSCIRSQWCNHTCWFCLPHCRWNQYNESNRWSVCSCIEPLSQTITARTPCVEPEDFDIPNWCTIHQLLPLFWPDIQCHQSQIQSCPGRVQQTAYCSESTTRSSLTNAPSLQTLEFNSTSGLSSYTRMSMQMTSAVCLKPPSNLTRISALPRLTSHCPMTGPPWKVLIQWLRSTESLINFNSRLRYLTPLTRNSAQAEGGKLKFTSSMTIDPPTAGTSTLDCCSDFGNKHIDYLEPAVQADHLAHQKLHKNHDPSSHIPAELYRLLPCEVKIAFGGDDGSKQQLMKFMDAFCSSKPPLDAATTATTPTLQHSQMPFPCLALPK